MARCRKNLPAWRDMGYRIAVLQGRERGEIPADITLWSDTYEGWPHAVNHLCAHVVPRSASIVVAGGDDMLPDPVRRAHDIAAEFFERFPDGFGVLQPQGDAFNGSRFYCGSPWLGRGWIDHAYGGHGPIPTGYRHNWADNELYWVAKCLGVLWERPDLSQYHDHFARSGGEKPGYWRENAEGHDREDVQRFLTRAWSHFPGHEPRGLARTFDVARFAREYTHAAEAYWIARYGPSTAADGPAATLLAALSDCQRRGLRRVAVFGAGSHTRAAAGALMQPPVAVVAIIDENAALQGRSLWNYPIVSVADAMRLAPDAVILSSRTMEDELVAAAMPLSAAGVEVVRLYAPGASPVSVASPAR
ncbi:MAG: nucleoside-diphosphate sugar epimerase/dehydratase [Phycisphaerales bacterium]